ncbi:MAG: GNAT family N-acetyltransferase [Clostridiales bacterium]|jgi:N-acetylglutamate synthase-like GNAT family acetyltransferase|nr:GNAT family N-acetyltransferase [Clostridiales bacterium]
MKYKIYGLRENPVYLNAMVDYYSSRWKLNREIWYDLIADCITARNPLPRWYLMLDKENVIGCIGLMTDDVTKKDFKPEIAGIYVEENARGKGLGGLLLEHAWKEARKLGFTELYCTTYHTGYFEKYGWKYLGEEESGFGNKVRRYVFRED